MVPVVLTIDVAVINGNVEALGIAIIEDTDGSPLGPLGRGMLTALTLSVNDSPWSAFVPPKTLQGLLNGSKTLRVLGLP